MGQYYKIVNLNKKQYLHPHKFGCGLKLMEFSGAAHGIMQGLAILLADGNNRGGGDLRSDESLIGSWAGDKIVVAGDYADAWKFVPKSLKGKKYETDVWGENGSVKKTVVFGQDPDGAACDETLYSTASSFYKDISDDVIRVIANTEYWHPWNCMDLSNDGWRDVPWSGVLPESEPETPLPGYAQYKLEAVDYPTYLIQQIAWQLKRNPKKRDELWRQILKVFNSPNEG